MFLLLFYFFESTVLKMQTASCLSFLEEVRRKKSWTELTLLLFSYYLSVCSLPIPLPSILPWSHGENLPIPAVRADSQAFEFKELETKYKTWQHVLNISFPRRHKESSDVKGVLYSDLRGSKNSL